MGKDLELLLSKYFLLVLQKAILTSTLLLRFATTTTMSFAPKTAPEFHEERAALIAELYANISLGNGVMEGTPETQAFLWLGDAGCLRALVEESRESPRVARSLLGGALQSTRVADTCEFRHHCSVSGISADNLCHNRVGQYQRVEEQKGPEEGHSGGRGDRAPQKYALPRSPRT